MKRFLRAMNFCLNKRDISRIKTKHVLLAIVGMVFLSFYIGIRVSGILRAFRIVLFVCVLFLMGLYGVHRFWGKKQKTYAGHVGLMALLLFVGFVGIQTQRFLYYDMVGIGGVVLLLPAVRDVMKRK